MSNARGNLSPEEAKARRDRILELSERGRPLDQIAEQFDVNIKIVQRLIREARKRQSP